MLKDKRYAHGHIITKKNTYKCTYARMTMSSAHKSSAVRARDMGSYGGTFPESPFPNEVHFEVWCTFYPRNGMITTRQRPLRFLDAKPARKNAPRACAICAARKVSCDIGRPCKRCVKAHIEHLCVDVETKRRTTKHPEPGESNETDLFSALGEAPVQADGEEGAHARLKVTLSHKVSSP